MNVNQIRLEFLPNETLLEIFEYLDARDLYRAFDNLNFRFNGLIRSLNQLCLTLSPDDHDNHFDDEIWSSSISTLIVNKNASVILGHFTNIRRLILHWLPNNVLDKLEADILPHLEYFYIDSRYLSEACSTIDFYDKIFMNGFPQLKFCSLSEMNIERTYLQWSQIPSINVLKIGRVNLVIYKKILSSCPNLSFFEFTINEWDETPIHIEHYANIKTLVIKKLYYPMVLTIHLINMYLSCVPNLQRLSIRLTPHHIAQAKSLSESDWLSSIINLQLSKLRQFNFYLPVILYIESNEFNNENFLYQLEQNFKHKHKNHYQSELIIDRIQWENRMLCNSFDDTDE